MGVRDLLTRHDSKFVSVRDLVAEVAGCEHVSLADAARAIRLSLHETKVRNISLSQPDGAYLYGKGSEPSNYLLNAIIESNDFKDNDPLEPWYDHAFYHTGWFKSEITPALEKSGIPIPNCLLETAVPSRPCFYPDWTKPYLARTRLSLGEASCLIAGIDPHDQGFQSDAEIADLKRYRAALIDAIEDNEIAASSWGMDRDSEQQLSHDDIRDWCNRYGFAWPVPLPPNSPTTSTEDTTTAFELKQATQRMSELEAENSRLTEECERLNGLLANKPRGDLAGKLEQAIAEYPAKFASTKGNVTLDKHVRPWLNDLFGWKLDSRPSHVIGRMIAQHFNVDTESGEADTPT